MANAVQSRSKTIHGRNPTLLVEDIIRKRIWDSIYWKEQCFGLTSETIVDKAAQLKSIGGLYGNSQPSEFLCLALKLLQLQPERDIVDEYLNQDEFKYLRALAAFYVRLTMTPIMIYETLEPMLASYSKMRYRDMSGYSLTTMDEFVDQLLRDERVCDIIMPRIAKRSTLETNGDLPLRTSVLHKEGQNVAEGPMAPVEDLSEVRARLRSPTPDDDSEEDDTSDAPSADRAGSETSSRLNGLSEDPIAIRKRLRSPSDPSEDSD